MCWVKWDSRSASSGVTIMVRLVRTRQLKMTGGAVPMRQSHELLTNHSPDPGSADAQPIPVPNTLENQLHSVTGPHQLGGRWWKSAKSGTENRFMYFMMARNHAPLPVLGTDPRPLVELYVGSSRTVARRPPESPAWCTWLESATQNVGK